MTVTVYHGDCTAVLPTLAAGSVQCCVTSPPYFGLRAYPHAPTAWPAITFVPVAGLPALTVPAQTGHLGAEADPWVYVAHLVHVFRAVWRVLRDDGTLWLNLGDSYASDSKWGGASGGIQIGRGPEKVPRCQRQTGLGEKQLLMLPFRVVQALQADGWYVRTVIPWIKVNAMPESVRDRPVLGHEYMFVLARSRQYFYDVAAITVPATSTHGL
jgi:DNA modification methylase